MTTDIELYFRYRCEKGLRKRNLHHLQQYIDQLEYEINVITQMGFCSYFLIVSDILTWATNNDIAIGPGRGSCAGSLVSYCMEITHIDPIKYGLFFERFLNFSRKDSPPDSDSDIEEEKRDEVINYIKNKYGEDKVAHIGTYGTMKAKAAIKDVARALGFPYTLGEELAKLTLEPISGKPQPLSISYDKVIELHNIRYGEDSKKKTVLMWAEKIENRIKSFSTHASGIVIAPTPISSLIPVYPGKEGVATTQFDMGTVEEVGLIKFDFLALRAVSTIKRCINIINKLYNTHLTSLAIPIDDQQTYKNLQMGDVEGIFQLECSSGMRDLLVQIRPTNLDDLGLLVAIFRPGPLGTPQLIHYLKVRAGEAEPDYLFPELEPVLKNTQGLLVYQESVMRICSQIAGYTNIEADNMRKILGKKKVEAMLAEHDKFVLGLQKNNISQQHAEQLFTTIEEFSRYSFNKSHAISYAYISYQMAYLKTHYPIEFMCSCLISDSDESDKIIKYISYCNEKGIKILPPSINHSEYNFSIHNNCIRFGLGAIKNIGKPIQAIIQEREKNGPFHSILDFANRVDLSKINRKKLESLVLAGTFDDLGNNTRSSLMIAITEILRYRDEEKQYTNKLATYIDKLKIYEQRNQDIEKWQQLIKEDKKSLKKPGRIKEPIPPEKPTLPFITQHKEINTLEILFGEKELLGFYVSGHPLDNIKEKSRYNISRIKEEVNEGKLINRSKIRLIAIPSIIKVITTKKNKQKMAYLDMEDKSGSIQGVVLPNVYIKCQELIDIKTPALYDVDLEVIEGDIEKITKLVVTGITSLHSIEQYRQRPIDITIPIHKRTKVIDYINSIKTKQTFASKLLIRILDTQGNEWCLDPIYCNEERDIIEKHLKELKL